MAKKSNDDDRPVSQKGREQEAQIDEASEASFPASDPMPFSPTTPGAPSREKAEQRSAAPRTPRRS
jgi:hypothetical protein